MSSECYMRLFAVLVFVAQGSRSVERAASLTDYAELGSGNDVCEPHKGWLWNAKQWEDKKLVDRFVYKQERTLSLAKWIDAKHCLFAFKGTTSCTYQWYKLSERVRKFSSCGKIPRNGTSELAQLVWGDGENSLKDFLTQVLKHMSSGLNRNSHVKSWLKPGNCTFEFGIVADSTKKHIVEMKGKDEKAVADAILDDVFGSECKPKKVSGLKGYRKDLKKKISITVKDARAGNLEAIMDRENDQTKLEDMDDVGGHELDTEGKDDDDDDDDDEPASSLQQFFQDAGDLGGSLIEQGMQAGKADILKILCWVILFCLTGPIALIIALIVYILDGPRLLGI